MTTKTTEQGIKDLLENTPDNYFITGKAGTGKSTLLTQFRDSTNKNVAVVAPTGIAAINIGGSTIHSFFRLPPKVIETTMITRNAKIAKIVKHLDTLIIDEISMVRADLLDAIDYSLRLHRFNMNEPFGGVQVIFFGDLMQLPPVIQGKEMSDYFEENYHGPYFFNAKVFTEFKLKTIELINVYRQTNQSFISLLDKIRSNMANQDVLDSFNKRFQQEDLEDVFQEVNPIILLTTNNYKAGSINIHKLSSIDKHLYEFRANIKGDFGENIYPTQEILQLKEGAQIMMLRNDTPKQRWQNGTLGVVSKLNNKYILVNINGKEYKVDTTTWDNIEYRYNRESNKLEEHSKGTFTQFPIKLAWAITIHKSQGQTFDNVIIDLDRGSFTHGQTYVALSRCRTLEGIYLTQPLTKRDVIVDQKIVDFLKISQHP